MKQDQRGLLLPDHQINIVICESLTKKSKQKTLYL
jgi:hypothetical protein